MVTSLDDIEATVLVKGPEKLKPNDDIDVGKIV